MTIGEKIKRLRIHTKLTQKKLGELSGTSEITIRQYEAGKRQPRIEQLKKIAKVFDFPLYLLLDDNYDLGNAELEMKRARPFKSYEMTEPPGPFTVPLSQYNNKNNSLYIDPNLQKLYEIARQKAHNREKLTDEEEQILIGIPGKLRNKSDDPLSYDNSYSFASSEEEFKRMQDAKQIELEKKRAKPFKLYETDDDGPPKPFTRPLQSSYDKPSEPQQDNSLKLHTNTRGIDWEQLDDFRFDELMLKLDRGEDLTPTEINFKSAYLERCLKKVGHIFAKFYSMLNVEGQKKADEQIDRAIEQVELLTKIPEYQKTPPEPPKE